MCVPESANFSPNWVEVSHKIAGHSEKILVKKNDEDSIYSSGLSILFSEYRGRSLECEEEFLDLIC